MRWIKAIVGLLALVLMLQTVGASRHKHDLGEQANDCVSCYLASHLPSPTPADTTVVLAAVAMFLYSITLVRHYRYSAPFNYLIPHSHAPPAHS